MECLCESERMDIWKAVHSHFENETRYDENFTVDMSIVFEYVWQLNIFSSLVENVIQNRIAYGGQNKNSRTDNNKDQPIFNLDIWWSSR